MIKTFWKAIHSDHTVDSKDLSDDYHPYKNVKRATLQKVIFYDETGKTLQEFENCKDIAFRLRPILTNGQLTGRRWIIENDNKVCVIDYNNVPHIYNSYEESGTYPIIRGPIDET